MSSAVPRPPEAGASYASAGVDVEAGERAVALMRASVQAAQRPEVVGDFGGFAGLFDISARPFVPPETLCFSVPVGKL